MYLIKKAPHLSIGSSRKEYKTKVKISLMGRYRLDRPYNQLGISSL